MLMPTIQSVTTMNFSNILESFLLKKFTQVPFHYDKTEPSSNYINKELELKAFELFYSVITGNAFKNILLLNFEYVDVDGFYKSVYTSNFEETISELTVFSELLKYFSAVYDYNIVPFSSIPRSDVRIIEIEKDGYDFENEKDFKTLMNYFWSYPILVKVKVP